MTAPTPAAPEAGHKCKPAKAWVEVSCECGWRSGQYCGKGARAAAYADWRAHIKVISA